MHRKKEIMSNDNILCIAGMHRSGTSLITSWLEKCGLILQNKTGADVGNEKGHFEDKDFLELHTKAIKRVNPKSKGWIINGKEKLKFTAAEIEEANKIIEEKKKINNTWGWKDPRTALFLNEWKRLLPNMKVLIIWRDCYSTIDSLQRRTKKASNKVFKIKFAQAVKNWRLYEEHLLAYYFQNKETTIVLSVETILKNDRNVINLLNQMFNINFNYYPIRNLFDENAFHNDHSLSFIKRIYCRFQNVWEIEKNFSSITYQF